MMRNGDRILRALVAISVFGLVALALTALLAFEEANSALLLVSSILVLTAPLAAVVHLILTKELAPQEKRMWIQALASSQAPWVLSDYLTCTDRRAGATKQKELADARRLRTRTNREHV